MSPAIGLAVDHGWVLLALLACAAPLLGAGERWEPVGCADAVPPDPLTGLLDRGLRLVAAAGVAALVLGLAGLHAPGREVLRTGHGAHVAVVLDRSLSMDERFAMRGETAHERPQESKTEAAARMLAAFFARRPHDSFALVAFSSSPIPAMGLTDHRAAIAAAIAAMRRPALANTDIGGGIALGLAQFAHDAEGATRVLLLISDGAGDIALQTREYIRNEAARLQVHVYYLYLRSGDDPSLAEAGGGLTDLDQPAGLAAFLRTLRVPYEGFEARDPAAVDQAALRIDGLETHALQYRERTLRHDLDVWCYAAAAACVLAGLLARLAERDAWAAA